MKSKARPQPFKRVILYARSYRANQGVFETLSRVTEFLETQGVETYFYLEPEGDFSSTLPLIARQDICAQTDVICVIGGDGSMLSAARMAVGINVPVIGINRGRLGFLTDISPQHLEEQLLPVIHGEYLEEQRFLLETHLDSPLLPENLALNDIVLTRGEDNHLIDFDIFVNHEFMSHYRSDGLIVSTPTGSTAYALSAGGPIMHPLLNAIVLVPMFSHSLSSRPVVIDGDASISIKISPLNPSHLRLSCDGHASILLETDMTVTIKKHSNRLRLLHPKTYHYYDTLRSKLGWEANHQG